MALEWRPSRLSWLGIWSVLVLILSCPPVTASGIRWIEYTGNDGTVWLNDDRRPSLYTQKFGDCQGDSVINVTRFDAAYYKDNMTVLFHLAGNSALANESLMCMFERARWNADMTDAHQCTSACMLMENHGLISRSIPATPTSTACAP